MIYSSHRGFTKRESKVLDELLPKWNAKVSVTVNKLNAAVEIKPVVVVGGCGLFSVDRMARGKVLSYYGGELTKGASGISPYDMDTRMKIDFSRKMKGVKIPRVFVNGTPTDDGVHRIASRLNHACKPNSHGFYVNVRVGSKVTGSSLTLQLIRLEALRTIQAGEEITMNYGPKYVESRSKMRPGRKYTPCLCNGGRCPFGRMMRVPN